MVLYWAYSLCNGVGALPMRQELAGAPGNEEEHSVPQLELSGLCRVVVSLLLFPLCHLHVLLYNGSHLLYLAL